MTRDPAGFVDSVNLYQYVFNNPFYYCDPDGQFAVALVFTIVGGVLTAPTLPMIAGAALGVATAYYAPRIVHSLRQKVGGWADQWKMEKRRKKGDIKEGLSTDPLNDSNLEDISHPDSKRAGRHKLKDKETGEIFEFDEAKPGHTGHKEHNHYHQPNPNGTGKRDRYLDSKGNPVPDGSDKSHLYPPEWVWWN